MVGRSLGLFLRGFVFLTITLGDCSFSIFSQQEGQKKGCVFPSSSNSLWQLRHIKTLVVLLNRHIHFYYYSRPLHDPERLSNRLRIHWLSPFQPLSLSPCSLVFFQRPIRNQDTWFERYLRPVVFGVGKS